MSLQLIERVIICQSFTVLTLSLGTPDPDLGHKTLVTQYKKESGRGRTEPETDKISNIQNNTDTLGI